MFTCAPLVPSRKSTSRNTGSPSRDRPAGSLRATSSNPRARSRSTPAARHTWSPGLGGTSSSGSKRVACTCAASLTSAGSTPSATRNTSLSNRTPSWRARTCETTPYTRTISPSGRTRSSATTSSSWRYDPSWTPTQNSSGVASSVPIIRPTGDPLSMSWMVRRGCDSVADVDFLRTPDDRFNGLPGYPFEPNYVDVTAGDGTNDVLRVHFVDEGDRTSGETVLLMHGE